MSLLIQLLAPLIICSPFPDYRWTACNTLRRSVTCERIQGRNFYDSLNCKPSIHQEFSNFTNNLGLLSFSHRLANSIKCLLQTCSLYCEPDTSEHCYRSHIEREHLERALLKNFTFE